MKYRFAFLYALIILVSSIPLMNDFLIRGHDIYFHLMRIEGLADGLRCGQFPVRIQPTWYGGFGYAVSVFYGDLFLYLAAFLRLLGFSLQNAYKSYLFLCNVATTLIAGYSFGGIFKNRYIGVFGSAVYSLAVYRLVNLYTRGALGEYTGMMFLPLIVYACVLLLEREKKQENLQKGTVLLGVGMAFILQSHILTAELTGIMLVITVVLYIWRVWDRSVILSGLKAVAIALSLSLWFLVPFLDYMINGSYNINSTDTEGLLIQRMGIFLSQIYPLFDDAIGQSLVSEAGPQGDFAQGIGLGLFLAIPAFFLLALLQFRKKYREREWNIAFTVVLLGGLAVAFSTVYFPWDSLCNVSGLLKHVIVKIQFPWRFTAIASVCLTAAWCAMELLVYKRYGRLISALLAVVVVVLICLSAGHYFTDLFDRGQRIQVRQQQDMDSYVESGEEYLPKGTVTEDLQVGILSMADGVEITEVEKNGTNLRFHCRNTSDQVKEVELPLLYYPGYRAVSVEENTQECNIRLTVGENNVVSLLIDGNTDSDIMISFREPWYWRTAEIASVLSAVLLLASGVRRWRRKGV